MPRPPMAVASAKISRQRPACGAELLWHGPSMWMPKVFDTSLIVMESWVVMVSDGFLFLIMFGLLACLSMAVWLCTGACDDFSNLLEGLFNHAPTFLFENVSTKLS